ncbi:hypothetical protein CASFOL_039821 [Castilleja foliolosa]|uniref:RING-CH-type domain-containing protein n=1 Tax=Castilleja foliolosa TaxID=1961234 RepID=A0ABD3BGA0_9LAMI
MKSSEEKNMAIDGLHDDTRNSENERQVVVPIHMLENSSVEISQENKANIKNWRKSNLSLEVPIRTLEASRQEFVQIKMPTPTPTPKKVNFLVRPIPSDSRLRGSPGPISSTTAKSSPSIRNILPKPSMSRSWSFTKIFTPRSKRTSLSLPVTPIASVNLDSAHGGSTTLDTKDIRRMSRSLSVPAINKEKGIQKTDSYFRVIPTTPKVKDGVLKSTTIGDDDDETNNEADGEDIPKEEAVCRICLVELCEGGETLKMECSCKGELALAHQDCAVKWFTIKGNKTCDVCKQEVQNLPVTLLRVHISMNRDTALRNFRPMINGYTVWQDVPILVIVSMLTYFCFLEQLLVGKMGSSAIEISLPFSCVLALLASTTSSIMVTRRFVWVYASIQFVLVVLFGHIFYSFAHVQAVVSVLLSVLAGFGVTMGLSSTLVEILRWRRSMNQSR